jgi:hypothetical protein
LIKDLDTPIGGRNVILVEDILDTGLTLVFLRKLLLQHKPKTLKIATCLDKPARRLEKIDADYVAFTIPNHFVVGYGMDYQERFRNLPDIRIFNPDEAQIHIDLYRCGGHRVPPEPTQEKGACSMTTKVLQPEIDHGSGYFDVAGFAAAALASAAALAAVFDHTLLKPERPGSRW